MQENDSRVQWPQVRRRGTHHFVWLENRESWASCWAGIQQIMQVCVWASGLGFFLRVDVPVKVV